VQLYHVIKCNTDFVKLERGLHTILRTYVCLSGGLGCFVHCSHKAQGYWSNGCLYWKYYTLEYIRAGGFYVVLLVS